MVGMAKTCRFSVSKQESWLLFCYKVLGVLAGDNTPNPGDFISLTEYGSCNSIAIL